MNSKLEWIDNAVNRLPPSVRKGSFVITLGVGAYAAKNLVDWVADKTLGPDRRASYSDWIVPDSELEKSRMKTINSLRERIQVLKGKRDNN